MVKFKSYIVLQRYFLVISSFISNNEMGIMNLSDSCIYLACSSYYIPKLLPDAILEYKIFKFSVTIHASRPPRLAATRLRLTMFMMPLNGFKSCIRLGNSKAAAQVAVRPSMLDAVKL